MSAKKNKSSQQWFQGHIKDEFVRQAQREGYRSRAVYKLLEIQKRDRLLHPGQVVVDLGAAPGGWSQLASKIVGKNGRVIALDLLPIEPIPQVVTIQGDFNHSSVVEEMMGQLNGREVDLVISDMAPNLSGMAAVDQPRAMALCELALEFARDTLRPGGSFLLKVFQGEGFDVLIKELRGSFGRVVTRKPKSSRARSREVYVVAVGLN